MSKPFTIKKILCPTDFSQPAEDALDKAIALAQQHGATLIITHVIQPAPVVASPEAMSTMGLHQFQERMQRWGEESLDRWLEKESLQSVKTEKKLLLGRPADSLAEAAAEEAVDLIVIATHGHGGFKRFLFGSVAERLVRQADCPVLVVPTSA